MVDLARRWKRKFQRRPTPPHVSRYEGRLLCVAGPDAGKGFRIEATPALIGRDPFAMVQLTGDDISRRHARIFLDGDKLIIEDFSSRNGMLINGARLSWAELRCGDQIQMGATIMVYVSPRGPEARRVIQRRNDSQADTQNWTS
jgi:pSer/pThr/pTyr-binding forkhead associated (FHA) protein